MEPPQTDVTNSIVRRFCQAQSLPSHYIDMAQRYFVPLATDLASKCSATKPLVVGINGCQGSGKSTLSELLCELLTKKHALNCCTLSIDDFYLTKAEREGLAQNIHPLFKTRGVPGTHDANLLADTLDALSQKEGEAKIIRFNKAIDDRHLPNQWDRATLPMDVIILEGWCVGVEAQSEDSLSPAINSLEEEDSEGIWRKTVNDAILKDLAPIFTRLDLLIMLRAPSFDCVYQWRKTQEEKLAARLSGSDDRSGIMNDAQILRFIQHYQRLTEHMLVTMPGYADVIFQLNENHTIDHKRP